MKKGVLAAVGAVIWLGLTYFVVGYLMNRNCYIQTREIVYIHEPWPALDEPSPDLAMANQVQEKLNAYFNVTGYFTDSTVNEALNGNLLNYCTMLKVDSSYVEVLYQNDSKRGVGSYVITPDTIYGLEYRPVIIVEKARPD